MRLQASAFFVGVFLVALLLSALQQGTVQLPPVIKTVGQSIPAPLDLILILILIGGLILLMRWKSRKRYAQ